MDSTGGNMVDKRVYTELFAITNREWQLRQGRYFCTDTNGKRGLSETNRPCLISLMCPDLTRQDFQGRTHEPVVVTYN